jgi:hypothetical protein
MSPTSNPEIDPAGEELVAYLDGELPPEECRRVEERLATDASYRQQLRDLDQAWEALESLPATDVDENFARTTIEMVTVAAEREASDRAAQAAAVHRRSYFRWALGGIAAAAVGFAAAWVLLPNSNQELMANLPVIFQFDRLSQIEEVGVEFLRGLPAAVPLSQLAHDQAALERDLADLKAVAEPSRASRRQWVENLSPEQKTTLAAQFARFKELTSPQQEQLTNLEHELAQATDADQLQRSLVAYDHWLARRSSAEQEELRSLSTAERFEEIKRAVQRDDERAARHLSAQDAEKLRDEIFEIYEELQSDYWRAWRRDRDRLPRLDGPKPINARFVLHWALRDDDHNERTRDRLIKQLSPEAQANWNNERDRDRWWLLLWWIWESLQPKWGPQELEQFFANDLSLTERERLLSMDSDEMQVQLEQLYLADKFGLRGSEGWFGGSGSRGGMPPGPPRGPGGPGRGRDGRRRGNEGRGSRHETAQDERREHKSQPENASGSGTPATGQEDKPGTEK